MDQTGKNTDVEVCNWDGLLNSFYGSCQNSVCGWTGLCIRTGVEKLKVSVQAFVSCV